LVSNVVLIELELSNRNKMDFNLPVYVLPEFQALYQVMCVQW